MTTLATDLTALTQQTVGGITVASVTENEPWLNLLIYGESGVGKTVLSGSAQAVAPMAPVLFIDVEGGTLSLVSTYPTVDAIRVREFDKLQEIYEDLYAGRTNYKTVVIDSLTELQKFSMQSIMEDVVEKDSDRDPDVPAQRDWGKNQEQIRRFVRGFRDLPMHTIFTALSKEVKDPKTGLQVIRPDLPGKLAGQIAGFVDEVLYYSSRPNPDGGYIRTIQSAYTEKVLAKDRSGRLPPVLAEPTMQKLLDIITNSEEKTQNEG